MIARTFALDSRATTGGLPDRWGAPGPFGGMALAWALRRAAGSDQVPLSVSGHFHKPLAAGPIAAEVTALAATRRTRAVSVRLADRLTATATLVQLSELGVGTRRDGPAVPAPEALGSLPPARGPHAATLADHVHWRAITPWQARSATGEVLAWLAPRRVPWTTAGHLDPFFYLLAADLLGPALFSGTPFRIATVSLDVQILGLTRSPWLLQRVRADHDGRWAAGRIELWDRAGRLVATASQRARLLSAEAAELPWAVTAFGSGRSRLDCSANKNNSSLT